MGSGSVTKGTRKQEREEDLGEDWVQAAPDHLGSVHLQAALGEQTLGGGGQDSTGALPGDPLPLL